MDDHSLPAGTFKATCLKLMDEVAATGKSITITKRGKAVARLVPVEAPKKKPRSLFGALAHCTQIIGDIDGPFPDVFNQQVKQTLEEWDEFDARTANTKAARLRKRE